MNQGPDQLVAELALALLLVVVAGLLLSRTLRAILGPGWVTLPFPGRGLLRRALVLLLLLVLVGVLLDALTGEWGRGGGRLPVFVVESKKTPAIAAHVRQALAADQPRVLTRASGARQRANRQAACGHWPRGSRLSCDEYPFASTLEGGRGASIAGVPRVEQRRQGGALRAFYAKERVRVGDRFLVVVR
jgi:deoxyribonuclease NucA/NucB